MNTKPKHGDRRIVPVVFFPWWALEECKLDWDGEYDYKRTWVELCRGSKEQCLVVHEHLKEVPINLS